MSDQVGAWLAVAALGLSCGAVAGAILGAWQAARRKREAEAVARETAERARHWEKAWTQFIQGVARQPEASEEVRRDG